MAATEDHKSSQALDCSAQQFVLWALGALGLRATVSQDGVYVLECPEPVESSLAGTQHPFAFLAGQQFTFKPPALHDAAAPFPVELLTWESPLVAWLLATLEGGERLVHAVAARQPLSVHELAEHLFAQYRVDGGHVHLSGCSLEDRPFLRLSYLNRSPSEGQTQLVHFFGTSEGTLLDTTLFNDLELADLTAWQGRPPRIGEGILRRWTELTEQRIQAQGAVEGRQLVAVALVWCKFAEGKLTFSIGSKSTEVSFAGWGRQLADRRVLPPPYPCPLSGRSSYHLSATDDGRITVAEAIATCSESSRRVLDNELQRCEISGRLALPEYLQVCPVSGAKVLASLMEVCTVCQQRVSPRVLTEGRCPACRHLAPVSKADPDLARVLDAYPRLDRWRTWKMSHTDTAQVLVGSSAWKRLLVVVDKETLQVLHLATGNRLTSKWSAATDVQRDEWID